MGKNWRKGKVWETDDVDEKVGFPEIEEDEEADGSFESDLDDDEEEIVEFVRGYKDREEALDFFRFDIEAKHFPAIRHWPLTNGNINVNVTFVNEDGHHEEIEFNLPVEAFRDWVQQATEAILAYDEASV